ncbi:MAG: DUF1919 domain-containing protein [Pseudomonadota bacterium]
MFSSYYRYKDIYAVKQTEFVIVSNDCWGGSVYQWYKRPYNTPFVGVLLFAPCYLRLLSDFDGYMKKKLIFMPSSKYPDVPKTYPVALLGDIEIHFQHYKTESEAADKWYRRTERMLSVTDKNNYFFKFSDGARATDELLMEFHDLSFNNKLSFSINEIDSLKNNNHICMYESYKNENTRVPNGVKQFKLTFIYIDLNKWLTNRL